MLIVASSCISQAAKKTLSKYGELLMFKTEGLVPTPLACHPDLFITQIAEKTIVAPNIPEYVLQKMEEYKVNFEFGKHPTGSEHPECTRYNAVITNDLLIHNLRHTDDKIMESSVNKEKINVKQAYVRCTTIALDEKHFLTSDFAIHRRLNKLGRGSILVKSKAIELPGYKHGFIGGCCGINGKRLFINGALEKLGEQKIELAKICERLEIAIVELHKEALFDGGGIFFFNNK